jgi:hypothetical protein
MIFLVRVLIFAAVSKSTAETKMPTKQKEYGLLNSGILISWLLTFASMYLVSYLWHGVLLNDLSRISYPLHLFLFLVAIIYFGISLAIVALTYLLPHISNIVLRGWLIGLCIGVFIYLIAFAFGVSFYTNPTLKHILFDLSWQVVEGSFGGLVAAWTLKIFVDLKRVKV